MQVKYEPWQLVKEDKEYWGVRILEGKFNELALAINDVKMTEDDSVSVDYDIIYSLLPIEEVTESQEFNDTLSFIIQDILVKAMNEHENRNSNTAKLNI
jgi:hypothetical protein